MTVYQIFNGYFLSVKVVGLQFLVLGSCTSNFSLNFGIREGLNRNLDRNTSYHNHAISPNLGKDNVNVAPFLVPSLDTSIVPL